MSQPDTATAEQNLARVNAAIMRLNREQKADMCAITIREDERQANERRIKSRARELKVLESQVEQLEQDLVSSYENQL